SRLLAGGDQGGDRRALDERMIDGKQKEGLGFAWKRAQAGVDRRGPSAGEVRMTQDRRSRERGVLADARLLGPQQDHDRIAAALAADADDAVDDRLLAEDEQGLRIPHALGTACGQNEGGDLGGRAHRYPEIYTPTRGGSGACRPWCIEGEGEGRVGAGNGIRTRDFNLGKVALYH